MATRWTSKHTGQKIDDTIDYVSNPNLLDNWYFVKPINQRGLTEYSTIGYTIDRWKLPVLHLVSLQDNGIKVTCNAAASANFAFAQLIEGLEIGKQYTLSALIVENTTTKGVGLRHGNSASSAIIGTGLYTYTFNAAAVDNTSGFGIQFTSKADDANNYIVIAAIKLERGSQQTLAHKDSNGNWILNEIPNYGEQLRKCQRYFVNFNPYKQEWFAMPQAVASNANQAYSAVTLPVAMRTQPTVTYGGNIVLSQASDNTVTDIRVSSNTFTGNSIQLQYNVGAGGLTANSLYRVQGHHDSASYIHLSADL